MKKEQKGKKLLFALLSRLGVTTLVDMFEMRVGGYRSGGAESVNVGGQMSTDQKNKRVLPIHLQFVFGRSELGTDGKKLVAVCRVLCGEQLCDHDQEEERTYADVRDLYALALKRVGRRPRVEGLNVHDRDS